MALNLPNVFAVIGRAGRNLFLLNTAQSGQVTPFNELIGFAYVKPAWITSLIQSYDSQLRTETGSMNAWQQAAQSILMALVAADDPSYGGTISAALSYLYQQMLTQAATVKTCVITSSVTATGGNIGLGSIYTGLVRGDGIALQNVVAETGTITITGDSYTGGATKGREPWSWLGAPAVSSLATGAAVGVWDWDWPTGSGSSASGTAISAAQYNSNSANLLTNGDWATWSGAPLAPSNWNLVVGTWGTTIQQVAGMPGSNFAVQFVAGATLNKLTHQFGPAATASGVTAGTLAAAPAYSGFALNFFLKASATITGGVMTVSYVDGSGTVINDQQGIAQSVTIALTGLSTTTWVQQQITLRLPVILPAVVRLQIAITTPVAGGNVNLAWAAMGQVQSSGQSGGIVNIYPGGPNIAVFSRPDAAFEAGPNPDTFFVTFTNDRAGATFGATMQTLMSRLFQTPSLILPNTGGAPTIADTLITAV